MMVSSYQISKHQMLTISQSFRTTQIVSGMLWNDSIGLTSLHKPTLVFISILNGTVQKFRKARHPELEFFIENYLLQFNHILGIHLIIVDQTWFSILKWLNWTTSIWACQCPFYCILLHTILIKGDWSKCETPETHNCTSKLSLEVERITHIVYTMMVL